VKGNYLNVYNARREALPRGRLGQNFIMHSKQPYKWGKIRNKVKTVE